MVISAMMKAVYPDAVTELRILSQRICCVISEQSGLNPNVAGLDSTQTTKYMLYKSKA